VGRHPFRLVQADGTIKSAADVGAGGGGGRSTLLKGFIDGFGKNNSNAQNTDYQNTLTTANHSSQSLYSTITLNSANYEGAHGYPFMATMDGSVTKVRARFYRAETGSVTDPKVRIGIYDVDEASDGRLQVTDLQGYWDMPTDQSGMVTMTGVDSGSVSLTRGKMYFIAYVLLYDYLGSASTCAQFAGNSSDFERQLTHGVNSNPTKQVYLYDASLDHTLPSTWGHSSGASNSPGTTYTSRPWFNLYAS